MKKIRFAETLLLITVLFSILETWYFGWNKTPQSQAETICDNIVAFNLGLVIYFGLSPIFKLIKQKIEESEEKEK